MRYFVFFISILISVHSFSAQRLKGTWQDYLSYSKTTKVVLAGNRVYCASTGGLFYFDTTDNSLNKFTSNDGLTDFGIKTIEWNETGKVLIVAYNNGNIDLIVNSKVANLPDIKRKQMTGDKGIYGITCIGNEAYLSCGFGIVVLNLTKQEVKDTWFIGENGSAVKVNDFETDGTYYYAATDKGIYVADKNNASLQDFRNWSRVNNIPHSTEKFSQLAFHSGKIIANYTPDKYAEDELYILNGNSWTRYLSKIGYAFDLNVVSGYLLVASRAEVYIVNSDHQIISTLNSYKQNTKTISQIFPRSAVMSSGGTIWIADNTYGLIKINGVGHEFLSPNGPVDNMIFSMQNNNGDLWIAPGGITGSWGNLWNSAYIMLFRQGEWKSYTSANVAEFMKKHDITSVVPDPKDADHLFAGSWGSGIFEFRGDKLLNHYTHKNSVLQSALPEADNEVNYVRIGGMDFDSQGNLWITNSETAKNLLKLTPDGKWESFVLPEVANNLNIGQILNTKNDDKWIIIPRGHDLVITDKTGTKSTRLLVTAYFSEKYAPRMNDIYSIAEDLNGEIWLGTSMGVAVYANPSRVWDTDNLFASQPGLDLNDGLYHPLLESETVTAIAVDGANRKWLGTLKSGVYLVSENGNAELKHFTVDNSPLLSNTITSISINNLSGEVFFGTREGLISYMGDATEGKSSYSNVYVFPNPVRETWNGPVTITGLIENTDVRITDITGNLVHKTRSLGGQAVWDGRTLNGNRPKTGVYLVFCTDKNGEEKCVTKFLFVH